MIKKLDLLLLRSFIGPLFLTFFVSLFVLDMQFFFVYMDDLIGKGIGPLMVIQLLVLMSSTMVPLALPLAVLLAAIMTFGNLGENYELVAIKSSGISLLRFMRPLFLLIVLIGFGAFFFNNQVIPVANLKSLSLLYDLRRSKPALNIRAGQFNNDLEAFSIKIGKKDKDGQRIEDVIIYDQTSGIGNDNIVLAKKGIMKPTDDKRGLLFRLEDGWRYQEGSNNRYSGWNHDVQIRMKFKRWDKVIDLSGLGMTRTSEELFKNSYQMMNVVQLSSAIDTIRKSRAHDVNQSEAYFRPYLTGYAATDDGKKVQAAIKAQATKPLARLKIDSSYLQQVPDSLKATVVSTAAGNVRNIKAALDGSANSFDIYTVNLDKHYVELHKRFTLSFACILMFLIGAPLGAIIRKGGLGLPIVVAIVFFLIYFIIGTTGEKLALSGKLPPAIGMWMSTAMLLPIAAILIQQARNDSQIFSKEWYGRIVTYFAGVIKRRRARRVN